MKKKFFFASICMVFLLFSFSIVSASWFFFIQEKIGGINGKAIKLFNSNENNYISQKIINSDSSNFIIPNCYFIKETQINVTNLIYRNGYVYLVAKHLIGEEEKYYLEKWNISTYTKVSSIDIPPDSYGIIYSIEVDGSGNSYVFWDSLEGNYTIEKYNFSGSRLWRKTDILDYDSFFYDERDFDIIKINPSGNFLYLLGYKYLNDDSTNLALTKIDALNGNIKWTKISSRAVYDSPIDFIITSDNTIYALERIDDDSSNNIGSVILKYNALGDIVGEKKMGFTTDPYEYAEPYSIGAISSTEIYTSGYYENDTINGIYLIKYNPNLVQQFFVLNQDFPSFYSFLYNLQGIYFFSEPNHFMSYIFSPINGQLERKTQEINLDRNLSYSPFIVKSTDPLVFTLLKSHIGSYESYLTEFSCGNGCLDSDGGRDLTIKGNVNVNGNSVASDYCKNNEILIEHYCNTSSQLGYSSKAIHCSCSNGVCSKYFSLQISPYEIFSYNPYGRVWKYSSIDYNLLEPKPFSTYMIRLKVNNTGTIPITFCSNVNPQGLECESGSVVIYPYFQQYTDSSVFYDVPSDIPLLPEEERIIYFPLRNSDSEGLKTIYVSAYRDSNYVGGIKLDKIVMCGFGKIWSSNSCISCPSSQSVCNNSCVNLNNDNFNCGSCGKVCHLSSYCSNGKCGSGPKRNLNFFR